GIRGRTVTGVQTCALPICGERDPRVQPLTRLALSEFCDLPAVYACDHDQVRRREQPYGTRELVGNVGVVEIREQHDESAMLEKRSEERRVGKEGRGVAWEE